MNYSIIYDSESDNENENDNDYGTDYDNDNGSTWTKQSWKGSRMTAPAWEMLGERKALIPWRTILSACGQLFL